MKTVALLATILLFASCSSSSGLIDKQSLPCGSGQDIDILAGLEMAGVAGRRGDYGGGRAKMIVNVANNSHAEVTVTDIDVAQMNDPDATFAFDRAHINVDVTIAEGKEHTFELPMTERMASQGVTGRRPSVSEQPRDLQLSVRVSLSNGDSYVCRYTVGSPY